MDFELSNGGRIRVGIDWTSFFWATIISLISLTFLSLHGLRRLMRIKRSTNKAEKVNMVKVVVPFTVSLEKERNATAVVSSSVRCRVEIYYRVEVDGFRREIEKNWSDDIALRNARSCCGVLSELDRGDRTFVLGTGRVSVSAEGSDNSKPVYPVVIIVRNLNGSSDPREGHALITTVEVDDRSRSARIISQYLKLVSGRVTLLKKMFPSGLYDGGTTDLCVVCTEKPVSRVVLPCKHACMCNSCFQLMFICPMCRADVQSFFCTSPERMAIDKAYCMSKFCSLVRSVWKRC